MSATRTQVCFTQEQRSRLDALAKREGKTLAAVVREAVEAHTAQTQPDVGTVLDEAFGAMPELEVPRRSEWDRG